ncbi:MAG TPA: hypothetical protein VK572_00295 [Burkholderiales bacterium]|nr:hypothetical protein [Burkholderiales bacterium]
MDNACYAERRAFLKALTTTTAAAWAVGACGGAVSGLGGTTTSTAPGGPVTPPGSTPTPPGNASPVWQTVPTISFTQGFPASISIANFVTDANGDALAIALNSGTLPPGVTFNTSTKSFVYDGNSPVASTSGIVLLANDGRP